MVSVLILELEFTILTLYIYIAAPLALTSAQPPPLAQHSPGSAASGECSTFYIVQRGSGGNIMVVRSVYIHKY